MTKKVKQPKDYTSLSRLLHIILFSGSLATAIYLGILVANPDAGQYTLAGFATANAVYFLTKAIK